MYLIFHLLFPGTFNHEDSTHAQMLFTLYYKLTNLHCPSKTGSHWELLGFQVCRHFISVNWVWFTFILFSILGIRPFNWFPRSGSAGPDSASGTIFITHSSSLFVRSHRVLSVPHSRFPFHGLESQCYLHSIESVEGRIPWQVSCLVRIINTSTHPKYFEFIFIRLIRDKNSVFDVVNVYYGAVLFYIYNSWRNENLTLVASGELLKSKIVTCPGIMNRLFISFLFFFFRSWTKMQSECQPMH